MAFPTSPSNNQVHKQGNRTFAFDSATSVWDRVREADNSSNNMQAGTLGSEVTFPRGHVLQTLYTISPSKDIYTTNNGQWNAYVTTLAISINRTAGTKFMYMVFGGRMDNLVDSRVFKIDIVRSTGASWSTTGLSRFGHGTHGISTIGSGDAGEKTNDPTSLAGIDEASLSGNYTYVPVFTGTDGGGQYFNKSNGGNQYAIGIEFIG